MRKSWDELSPAYRRRLEKAGITRTHHSAGHSVQRARGHTREDEGLRRLQERWLRVNGGWSGEDEESFREVRAEHDDRLVYSMLRYQERMQDAYQSGNYKRATDLYAAMPPEFDVLPDWMKKYHGLFSF